MKKILFLCGTPPHPIHQKFAESIGAKPYHFPEDSNFFDKVHYVLKIPKDQDVYFSEGLFGYIYLAKLLGRIPKNSKTINLFSDPRLIQLVRGKRFNFKKNKVVNYPFFRKYFQKKAIKNLDAGICVGDYSASLLRRINSDIKIVVVPPLIERDGFFNSQLSPINKNNILSTMIGPDYDYKGLDFLVNVFGEVSLKNPDSKLFIVGDKWEKYLDGVKNKNIIFLGKKNENEIKDLMDSCSLYCHFGRGEAMGIVVLEAMAHGIPCIVSDMTGAKEYVGKVNKNFVIPLNKTLAQERILNYFNLTNKEKLALGKKSRLAVKHLTMNKSLEKFKEKFNTLIKN